MSCEQTRCKVKHIIFKCRCDKEFCLRHLLPEKHKCTYNYKQVYKDNPPAGLKIIRKRKVPSI